MNIDSLLKVLDSVTKLLGVIIWPLVTVFVLFRFRSVISEFIANVSEFSFKGAGIEASGRLKQAVAAAALAAASVSHPNNDAGPESAARNARAAAEVVADLVTPSVIRRAGRSTVLWVDDRPDNNVHERQSLEALGVSFVLAKSTDEAMDKIKRQSFDAVISDMGRPPDPQAGYTLLDRLRADGNQTPFIIYASSRAPEHQSEAKRRGAVGCTNRPSELFEMVLSVLGRWHEA
ncbi:MAG TPA: response regulator [Terracidiphilus sp.]|nr:response regulator [Terracidiphilus sp.]